MLLACTTVAAPAFFVGITRPVPQPALIRSLVRASKVSSLVGLRQLVQGPGDQLEGASYRCNLTEPAAHAIAANLKVPLADYLRLA